jgi:uncharacterized LabA/DUF88 family protein
VSKNVAVFVDVANIFYAAKAAGIDIDYVTLLKSATAGRDFVRAYAYTGLDPENENQRQFHSFLARSGYKVISKDIRKYGDGRIKANLDIELVVDMMKTARNLDIAVVVSGDGDFAPAIRAVQEQGVRVEVISFRGNTSSDLIEVADLFTDIAQIARVEKGSARSGRRVAAEGDLSMTEVPDKETEGAPRRRRGGRTRDDRPETPAASGAGRSSNLIVLPGERLSRGAGDEAAAVGEGADGADLDELVEVGEGETGEYAGSENGAAADAGRRRRRRGGRGRGRGRGRDSEEFAATGGTDPATEDDEDEDLDELPPVQPPVQTFGSVWDSQIGVPSSSASASAGSFGSDIAEDDEDLDEPEVPEYLLAERRQRGRQGGNRPGGRQSRGRSAYQAALDRERYGNRAPQPSFGGSSPTQGGNRPDRNRDRGGRSGRPQQGGRTYDRAPRQDARPVTGEPRSAEPWSEVPPEVEEMLRAEMARKAPTGESRAASSAATNESQTPPPAFSAAPDDEQQPPAAKPARRTRSPKATSAPVSSPVASADEAPAQEKPKRKTAARSTKSTTTRSKSTKAAPADDSAASADAAPEPAKKTTRRRTTKAAAEAPAEES